MDLGVPSEFFLILNPQPSRWHTADLMLSSSTMLTIFGGLVDDLRPMLEEERFADGWEPRIRSRFGLTMAAFNGTVLPVERGVNLKEFQ